MKKIKLIKIKDFILKKKKIVIPLLIVLVVVSLIIFGSNKADAIRISTATYSDLAQSVRATGQVISKTDLDLSFNKSGVVKSIRFIVGDKVKKGQIIANLEQGEALAKITQANGSLLAAKARYNKIYEGATNEEVVLAEVALKNAETDLQNTKNSQSLAVKNANRKLLNSSLTAYSTTSSQTPPTISGTYLSDKQGEININVYQTGDGYRFTASGVVDASGLYSSSVPQPLSNSGLSILFPSSISSNYNWTIPIPNKNSSDYLTNLNAYESAQKTATSAIDTATSLVNQRQAELNLKKANARPADLDLAEADIISAQGSLALARSAFEDTVIRAPSDGTITRIDIKYGELASASSPVITVEDVSNLYIEALINESNIANLEIGQDAEITFDAFGPDKKFTGSIAQIDPSAEKNDGVVNYKIKISINEADETIRPGMNADVKIVAGTKEHVIAVPNFAVEKKEGKSYIKVVIDEKKEKYESREVSTGFLGDNNLIEIKSGLIDGEKIVIIENEGQ